MGWNFRRSLNLGPLRINASRSGLGYSFGTRGFRVGKDAKGRKYSAVSVPGTGIYRRDYLQDVPPQSHPGLSVPVPAVPPAQGNPANTIRTGANFRSFAWLLYVGGGLLLYLAIRVLF